LLADEGVPVMSGSNSDKMVTVSAQLSADSQVAEAFEQYRDVNAMNSKSEAVRQLLRVGLADQMEDREQGRAADETESSDTAATIDIDLIRGNEAIILSAAFLVGSDNLLAALTAMAGTLGSWLFGFLGLFLLAWLFFHFVTNELELGDGLRSKGTGAD